jgi:transposase-like protein
MSKPKAPTRKELDARFPDDAACLEHLMRLRYGAEHTCEGCGRMAKYYRAKERRSYACEWCGHQVYPMAGTPFEGTRTDLKDWFFVMFLFCASRNGVAAKEVQRQLGVTYKTAWRMCNLIRQYMGYVDGDDPVGGSGGGHGIVEIDKTFIGGEDKRGEDDKKIVVGVVERGGDAIMRVAESRRANDVIPHILENVKPGSKLATDNAHVYRDLDRVFERQTVDHRKGEYVRGSVHTNTIEGLWSNLKRGINGTYIHVSKKHLQTYLHEFEFRHNLRHAPHLMLDALLLSFPRP